MKREFLILLVLLFCAVGTSAWGQNYCPADTFDRAVCDTMYIEPWAADTSDTVWSQHAGPYIVRVGIYVTSDVADPDTQYGLSRFDSLSAFVIPLCYTHTNPTKYCSLSAYRNASVGDNMWSDTRGIFRHLAISETDTTHNWMKSLKEKGEGEEWSSITLALYNKPDSAHFWLSVIASGSEDPTFSPGSRILLATMTFKLQDTMQICMDTCFWPPSSGLAWETRYFSLGQTKVPRMGTPHPDTSYEVCFNFGSDAHVPHFTIDATPDTQSITAGFDTTYNVILTSVGGFSTPCTLSATGVPTYASANFVPNPVTPTNTSVLTISTPDTTPAGTYDIWVISKAGMSDSTKVVLNVTASGVKEIESSDENKPTSFSLSQNYPNPFNPVTNFQFSLPKFVHVRIDIFNIVGQKVITVLDRDMKPGVYVADWNGKDEKGNSVSSGIYFYRMQAGDFSEMKKMVLLK